MGETVTVPKALMRDAPGAEHYVLRVVGDSMIEEGIADGDFLIILRRETAIEGEMVIAEIAGERTVKRFYPFGEKVRLQASNKAMAPIWLFASEVAICGIVVGLMRRM